MKFFLTLFLSISFLIASSQDTIIKESKNTMTGIYSQSGTSQKISLSLLSDNSIKSNLFDISTGTTFAYVYGTTVLGNDIQQKTYIRYDNEFLLHVFNYSYIRGINSENSYGIGYGKWWKLVSVTYALLYQTTQYSDFTRSDIYRHSFRLKFHFEIKKINLSFEYYYQPNIILLKDNIVYGITKLSFIQTKDYSLSIIDLVNYRSISDIPLIHMLTVGISVNIKNKK